MDAASKTLGIIGFGAFGRFMAGHLAPWYSIQAWDKTPPPAGATPAGVVLSPSIAEVAACDIVVFAVPWDAMPQAVSAAAPHIRPGTLAVDVTSVKSGPAELLPRLLPNDVDILCTHPLFGPQSGKDGISGMRVALCPIRLGRDRYYRACDFLTEKLSLLVIKTTPEKHDREMAKVQAITHFMSRALKEIGLAPSPMATRAYEKLQEFSAILLSDSWDLFLTIQNGNPFAAEMRRSLMSELERLESRIRPAGDAVTETPPRPGASA